MKGAVVARWSIWPVALLLLLAAALRLWRLPVLPPGLGYDEAINGVDVRMVLSGGGWPIYFLANNGREPLFIYLQALAVALLGYRPYTLRLVSALVGIATVPVIYACGLALIPSRWPGASDRQQLWLVRLAALLAAAGLAVSYWHLSLSRIGLRAVLLPPLSALMVLAFWRGWTLDRRRYWLLAGVSLALALYTYTAARFLPLMLGLFLLSEALLDAWRLRRLEPPERAVLATAWRRRLSGVGVLALTCAIVVAPLALAALREPAILSGRSDQVSIFQAAGSEHVSGWQLLAENAVRVARNFYDRGGSDLHFNLPGRPVNDPLLAVLFTVGWLAALRWLREPRYRLLLIWLAVMLLPTLLSTDAPHGLRAAGALPPLALLYGAGAATLVAWLRVPTWRVPALALLAAAVIIGSGALTARDYFGRWASSRRLGEAFDLQYQLATDWAAQMLREGRPVLLSHYLYVRPQAVFGLGLPDVRPAAEGPRKAVTPSTMPVVVEDNFDAAQPMYVLWQDWTGLHSAVLQPLPPSVGSELAAGRVGLAPQVAPLQRDGWPQVWTGLVSLDQPLQQRQIANPLDVTFANGLHLSGYEVRPDTLDPETGDRSFRLTLSWDLGPALQSSTMAATEAFVHLTGAQGVLATSNGRINGSYLAVWPKVKGALEDVREVVVPPDAPPGKAFFEVGLDRPSATGGEPERIPVVDPEGRPVADQVDLGAVLIGQGAPGADLSDLKPVAVQFGDSIELVGWQAKPAADDPLVLEVTVGWRARSRPPGSYTAFVHLVDGQGKILAQQDAPPGGAANPTGRWAPGESVRSVFRLPLSQAGLPPGAALEVGLYEPASGRRVAIAGGGAVRDDALILAPGDPP